MDTKKFNTIDSSIDGKIRYGRLKNLEGLTDQILVNLESEAQQKDTKLIEFEIGDRDEELCSRAGYNIFEKNGNKYAAKDLHNEIDLKGGLFKSNQEYELD